MRATHSLEAVFGSRSRVMVLRELASVGVPVTASQLAARTGLSKPAVGTVLEELGAMGLVASAPAGRARVHWLERENVYVQRLVEPAFAFESHLPDMLVADLGAAFGDFVESVVLFGSYARGEQSRASDVDVVVVVGDDAGRARLEDALSRLIVPFRKRYGASLSALVCSPAQAGELWRTEPDLQRALEVDGVVVKGTHPWEWRDGSQED